MNTLSKICTVLMLAGATSLMAADGDANTQKGPGDRGGKGGPRTHERGERGSRGDHHGPGGNFTIMICPNCRHRLIVLSPDGHGGRGPREGREGHGPGRGRRERKGGAQKQPSAATAEKSEKTN